MTPADRDALLLRINATTLVALTQLNRIEDKLDRLLSEVTDPEGVYTTVNVDTGEIVAPRTPTGRRKRVTEVTPEFRQAMNTAIYKKTGRTYTEELGGVDEVQGEIDKAVARKAHETYNDKQVDVRGYLNRAVKYEQARAPGGENTYDARQEAVLEKHRAGLGRRQIGRDG